MSTKKSSSTVVRNTALCYVRLSYTRNGADADSPERQRANIQAICDRKGWKAEVYEDIEGHRSGTNEEKRPGWLSLKTRLADPDVIAVVANDLSRVHRNVANQATLNQLLGNYQVVLVLAATNEELNFSGDGKSIQVLTTNMRGMAHELYALDISQKQIDSIKYRRSLGKHIGNPPFGTVLKEGYLTPSPHGAWLLGNGTFIQGTPDNPPESDALWRSYYEAAKRVLTIYADGNGGNSL